MPELNLVQDCARSKSRAVREKIVWRPLAIASIGETPDLSLLTAQSNQSPLTPFWNHLKYKVISGWPYPTAPFASTGNTPNFSLINRLIKQKILHSRINCVANTQDAIPITKTTIVGLRMMSNIRRGIGLR